MRLFVLGGARVAIASPAVAQHGGGHMPHATAAPNAGSDSGDIKAMSAQAILDLREGRGMNVALAAELNGYPGPINALEHAEALGLSESQWAGMEHLMTTMRRHAIAGGERSIEAESMLDSLFSERRATPEALAEATPLVARGSDAMRAVHLATHIAARAVLSDDQVARYGPLRRHQQPR